MTLGANILGKKNKEKKIQRNSCFFFFKEMNNMKYMKYIKKSREQLHVLARPALKLTGSDAAAFLLWTASVFINCSQEQSHLRGSAWNDVDWWLAQTFLLRFTGSKLDNVVVTPAVSVRNAGKYLLKQTNC